MTEHVNNRVGSSSLNDAGRYSQHELMGLTKVASRLGIHNGHNQLALVVFVKQRTLFLIPTIVEAMPCPGVVVRRPSRSGLPKATLIVSFAPGRTLLQEPDPLPMQ